MVGAQPANGANIKVDWCGIDWRGGREDGRNSSDDCVGGAASIVAQPDSAAHSCILQWLLLCLAGST